MVHEWSLLSLSAPSAACLPGRGPATTSQCVCPHSALREAFIQVQLGARMYGDMLAWPTRPSTSQPQMRRSKTASSLFDDDFDMHEIKALAATRARQRRHRLRQPVQKTEVGLMFREMGEIQAKAKAQHEERRVRKVTPLP